MLQAIFQAVAGDPMISPRLGSKSSTPPCQRGRRARPGPRVMAKQERYQLLEAAIYNLENMDNGRSKSALLGKISIAPTSGPMLEKFFFFYFVNADCQKRTVTVHQKVGWDIIKAHDVHVEPGVCDLIECHIKK